MISKTHKLKHFKVGKATYVVPELTDEVKRTKKSLLSDLEYNSLYKDIDYGKTIENIKEDSIMDKFGLKTKKKKFFGDNQMDGAEPTKEAEIKEIIKNQPTDKAKFKKHTRPTHFLHIPIDITASFEKKRKVFYNKMLELDYDFEDSFYHGAPHFTLMVMNIDKDQESLIQMILEQLGPELKKIMSIDKFNKKSFYSFLLSGLGSFRNNKGTKANVVFAEIRDEKFLSKVNKAVHVVTKALIEMGLVNLEDNIGLEFNETEQLYKVKNWHLTLMKNKKGFNDVQIMKKYSEFNFGNVNVSKLVLSKMDANHTRVCEIDL